MNVHVLDLFCGGGGSGLAMARLGLEPLGVDRDESALEIYRHVGTTVQGDVAHLDPLAVWGGNPPPWLIWASPPCQPWSEGRRNRGLLWGFETTSGKLLLEPLRWSEALKPRWVVVENVDGLPDEQIAPLADALARQFAFVSVLRLNARDWLPQNRGHVFVIGGPAPVAEPAGPGGKRFADILDGHDAEPVNANHLRYALRKRFSVPVVTPDDVLPTVTTRPYSQRWTAFVMTEPGVLRFPTFLEAARAQGFPDDHPIHDLYQRHPQIAWRLLGNAVPVPLAEAVLRVLIGAGGEGAGGIGHVQVGKAGRVEAGGRP